MGFHRGALRCGIAALCLLALAGRVDAQRIDFSQLDFLDTPAEEEAPIPIPEPAERESGYATGQSGGNADNTSLGGGGVSFNKVVEEQNRIKRQVNETIERARQVTTGDTSVKPERSCPICHERLNADGICPSRYSHPRCRICSAELLPDFTCPIRASHPRCPECNAELLADRSCPNYLNHRHREPVSGDVPAIVLLAILVVAIIVVVIARAGGDEDTIPPAWVPGGDWLSPFGNDDIVYSPPLSATDGGNGGFSEVCRARRKEEGRLEKECYILKFPRRGAEEAIRQSVRFEAMALEFLEKSGYRNAPLCRGQGQNLVAGANAPWYLMSCAPGRSLDKLMEEWAGKTFDRGNAGRLLKALCAALMDLHRIGVCHRDIKPRNIFWDERRVTLIDFGSARIPGAANPSEGNIPGTDRWEAPEQASGSYPVGQMADVYSFGLIFCAVVLAKPFLEDRWGPLRARYGTAVSAVVGGTISEIVFSKLLAAAPDDRNGALFALDAALKREW